MVDWLLPAIPVFKAVHIAALAIWCAGLLVLPLMLARHDPALPAAEFRVIRRACHVTYTLCATPAAVIAVIAGTWLIFLRETFVPWLFAKLAVVALLVAVHAWIGHVLEREADRPAPLMPHPFVPVALSLALMIAILTLVLAKPALGWIVFPDWLLQPRGGQLPFDVPSR